MPAQPFRPSAPMFCIFLGPLQPLSSSLPPSPSSQPHVWEKAVTPLDKNVVADLGPEPGEADKQALPFASCLSILPCLDR